MSASYGYKPSKPVGVLSVFMGIGMLTFAVTAFDWGGEGTPFLVFWCLAVVGITSVNAWAAFSERGSLGVLRPRRPSAGRDDSGPPPT